ncbi:S9 family peptidase [bacterium]|nr:S9 family peptidase [candidate division CSSED10-310 bacterium]
MAAKRKKRNPVTAEDFYRISEATDPQVHPDGNRIAYVHVTPQQEGKSYIRSIWIVDRRKGKPRRFTAGGKDGDYHPRWSPDGGQLAFISHRNGKPQIFLIPVDGGEARQFTSMPNGVSSPVWSLDGKWIAFVSRTRESERREEDRAERKRFIDERMTKRMEEDREYDEQQRIDPRIYTRTLFKLGTAFKDDRNSHIYIQKTGGGRPRRITDGPYDYFSPAWHPGGRYLVSSTKQHGDIDIEIRTDLVRLSLNKEAPVFLTDDPNANFGAQFSPDGKWIYFLSFQAEDLPRQRMLINRIPFEGGAVEPVTGELDYDPGEFQLNSDGSRIYFTISREGRDQIWRISAGGGKAESAVCGDYMSGPFHVSGRTLAYRLESPDIPGDIFCSDTEDLKPKRLTSINRRFLSGKALSAPKTVWLTRPDGLKIQGWIMLPCGYRKGKTFPWVIQVHGGPHIMWGYSWWHEFQSLCGKGYGVYFSNPRGSDGYGGDFKKAIRRNWGQEDSEDILAGADLVVKRGLADPERLYLTGGSFGGFMTAWIVTRDHRFRAAAAQRGVYNFISMYGVSDANTLIEWEFQTFPWKEPELLWKYSPLKYVENIRTPLMILHSEQDYRVGISQAEELYVALRRLGKEAELVRYPREGHELSRSGEPRHRVDRINRIIGWFDRHP